jgi:hypothetical protein
MLERVSYFDRVWDLETVADPGAEVCKSPLNVELLQALEGRSGQLGGPPVF